MEAKTDYVTEALDLLHGEPSLVIEPERTIIERRDGKFKETVIPAFVKISTSFKGELASISDAALKVWIFIALSVNRNTGIAHPGLRTIAAALGKGVNTIQECIKELEAANLLKVDRQSRKYNIYEPIGYVSANRADPVSEPDTVAETVSEKSETVSEKAKTVSDSQILNQRNQIKPEIPLSVENAIFANQPITEEMVKAENLRDIAPKMFERALGFSKPLPWWSNKDWTAFAEWVCERYAESKTAFGEYNIWRNTPYTKGGMSNNRIRGFVNEFYDSWDMFKMATNNRESEDNRHAL